jgi:hypothetical protein
VRLGTLPWFGTFREGYYKNLNDMAEIKIEKKPVWPWVLAALLVIGVIVFFLVRDDGTGGNGMAAPPQDRDRTERTDDRTARDDDRREDRAQVREVNEYVTYVSEDRQMGLDHEYTSGALERLEAAVKAKADQLNYEIQADLDRIDDHVGHITDDPMETTHANHIRSAADALSTAMRNMQRQHYPALDRQAQQVEQAAANIDPNTLTLDQRDAVKGFFDRSAELLRNMN